MQHWRVQWCARCIQCMTCAMSCACVQGQHSNNDLSCHWSHVHVHVPQICHVRVPCMWFASSCSHDMCMCISYAWRCVCVCVQQYAMQSAMSNDEMSCAMVLCSLVVVRATFAMPYSMCHACWLIHNDTAVSHTRLGGQTSASST